MLLMAGWALLSLYGCARPVNRTAERHIREALPSLLGDARYQVHVDGDPYNTVHGRLARVQVNADGLMLPSGLPLDHLYLDLHRVVYDMHHHKLVSIKSAYFTATIRQQSLGLVFAGAEPPGEKIRHLEVALFTGNRIAISGERVELGVNVPFRLSGYLIPCGGGCVQLAPNQMRVAGIPLGGALTSFLARHFQHSVNISSLLPAVLTGVETDSGTLTLAGKIDVLAWMAAQKKR